MPDQEIVDLLVCGPFTGIDTRTASIYADPKTATTLSNADTHRLEGALATALGRSIFLQFENLEGSIVQMAVYTVSQNQIFYIAQDNSGNIVYYDVFNAIYGTLGTYTLFTQSKQANGVLWMNNGQQIFMGPSGLVIARWQYAKPTQGQYGYAVSAVPGVANPLAPGIYSYAFVQKIAHVNEDSTTYQYTTPEGAISTGQRNDGSDIFPYNIENQNGTKATLISGIFAGYEDDGSAFTTQVFRYSTNSPAWFFLVELTNNSQYTDNATDASIAGNQQLVLNQDQPPTGGGQGKNPIESHQNRLWVCAIINDSGTKNLPQTQVQYSQAGEPWSFDKLNAVLLVEDNETTLGVNQPGITGVPFGDFPSGLCAVGSSLMVLRRQTTSLVYGVDESTYQPLKIFADLGCIAPLSLIKGNGLNWWLSAQGFYSFDGSNVQWISKPIYNLLQSLGPATLQTAVGAYKDLTCFWSFPQNSVYAGGLTLRYYIPTQTWDVLPYSTPSCSFGTSLPSDLTLFPLSMNQIAAVRPNSFAIDLWQTGDTDLGNAIVATFVSQESDTGEGMWEKIYKNVAVEAPIQPGVSVDITLFINEVSYFTWLDVDLGSGPPTKAFNVPNNQQPGTVLPTGQSFPNGASNRGYTCQLELVLHNAAGASGPAVIYRAKVGGTMSRQWTVRSPDRPAIPETGHNQP